MTIASSPADSADENSKHASVVTVRNPARLEPRNAVACERRNIKDSPVKPFFLIVSLEKEERGGGTWMKHVGVTPLGNGGLACRPFSIDGDIGLCDSVDRR